MEKTHLKKKDLADEGLERRRPPRKTRAFAKSRPCVRFGQVGIYSGLINHHAVTIPLLLVAVAVAVAGAHSMQRCISGPILQFLWGGV